MPIPKSLDELTTREDAKKFFEVVSDRLSGNEICAIKSGQVSDAERNANPKLAAACDAWAHWQSLPCTVTADGYSTAYDRA